MSKQTEYYKYLREYVGTQPLILPGAVVIIRNKADEVLLQKRPEGKWGLPGGLMNLGESFEQVAAREVYEEVGLHVRNLQLMNVYSGEKYYMKASNEDEFYCVTAVFLTDEVEGVLQLDPAESLEGKYFKDTELPEPMVGSHRMFIEASREARKKE